jgi:hypothetical protein
MHLLISVNPKQSFMFYIHFNQLIVIVRSPLRVDGVEIRLIETTTTQSMGTTFDWE